MKNCIYQIYCFRYMQLLDIFEFLHYSENKKGLVNINWMVEINLIILCLSIYIFNPKTLYIHFCYATIRCLVCCHFICFGLLLMLQHRRRLAGCGLCLWAS